MCQLLPRGPLNGRITPLDDGLDAQQRRRSIVVRAFQQASLDQEVTKVRRRGTRQTSLIMAAMINGVSPNGVPGVYLLKRGAGTPPGTLRSARLQGSEGMYLVVPGLIKKPFPRIEFLATPVIGILFPSLYRFAPLSRYARYTEEKPRSAAGFGVPTPRVHGRYSRYTSRYATALRVRSARRWSSGHPAVSCWPLGHDEVTRPRRPRTRRPSPSRPISSAQLRSRSRGSQPACSRPTPGRRLLEARVLAPAVCAAPRRRPGP
ncbi:hypothetical protein EDF63_0537 [Curtobacterium sp. JUb34]|nr:hypothetical protein EDF63_0537 [Curtobacterium sp. JUb34]